MNRSLRTFVVVAIAVALAGASTWLVYKTIQSQPAREVEVARAYAVVASHPLALGTRLTDKDVKLVPWPAANPVPGGFTSIADVIDRGVLSPIAENEPVTGNNLATKEAGAGLPPTIPPGMRAISVKVNEVIGVAGFVVPGTRVDVMAILPQPQGGRVARIVVSNVQVLTAGTRYDQELAKEGKALESSVVTLMVTPSDAELVGLAAAEGQIMLTLRNPMDTEAVASTGTAVSMLAGDRPAPKPAPNPAPRRTAAAAPPPVVVAAPAPPPAPKPVVVIKGGVAKEIIK